MQMGLRPRGKLGLRGRPQGFIRVGLAGKGHVGMGYAGDHKGPHPASAPPPPLRNTRNLPVQEPKVPTPWNVRPQG